MKIKTKRYFIALIIFLTIASAVCAVIQWLDVRAYNRHMYTVSGPNIESSINMNLGNRGDNTSTWIKNDFVLNGVITPMIGETVDGVLVNNSDKALSSWTMRFDVKQDCFLNQAWNGILEIHQNSDSGLEKVQTMNLQKYDLNDIELDYLFDGNLYIPLTTGDYFIYYPSEKFKEVNIVPGDETTIGIIFYHEKDIDLTSYQIDYFFHKQYNTGILFVILVILVIGTLIAITFFLMLIFIYQKAKNELELKISGISCMAELYDIVYMIDLTNNSMTPIKVDEAFEAGRPKDLGANELLYDVLSGDSSEGYREIICEFCKLSTVPDRMRNHSNISCEYISNTYGWCRIRFLAMDHRTDMPLEKVLLTLRVIDNEKKQMDEIRERVQKAESENSAKSAFLANISHEIRTPINTVLGLDTMILRESSEDNIRAYAKDIKNAGTMLLSLINGILDFSKLESGKMELIPANYSLIAMIGDVLSITRTKIESKNLEFIIDVNEDLPSELYGDDVRLKQIFINLLTNAAKYTEKGSVRLLVSGEKTDSETLCLHVSVKDTGIGIREEDRKKLSERFTRLDEKRTRNIEGTGIGINLVTGLLHLMGSELQLDSVYGEGSDFRFDVNQKIIEDVPVGKVDWNNVASSELEEYSSSFTAPNAHILVVDDNEMNLMVFENLLKETGLNIDKASGGRSALSLTSKNKYDIIFMDHMMPDMDGIETLNAIRSQEDGLNRETPEIILTANAMQGAKDEYMAQGFAGFIAKPIQPEILEEKIMEVLPDSLFEKRSFKDSSQKRSIKATNGTGIPEIEGVDGAYALEHIGSADGVLKMMKQFVTVADSETEELLGYYNSLKNNPEDDEALTGFRIKIHAMKTSAGLIGGLMVYGSAAQLEFAARDGKINEVLDTTPYFIDFWNSLRDKISSHFATTEPVEKRDSIDRETVESLLHQLITGMNAYDVKNADHIISELEKYAEAPEIGGILPQLKTAVANLDAEGCEKICREVIK